MTPTFNSRFLHASLLTVLRISSDLAKAVIVRGQMVMLEHAKRQQAPLAGDFFQPAKGNWGALTRLTELLLEKRGLFSEHAQNVLLETARSPRPDPRRVHCLLHQRLSDSETRLKKSLSDEAHRICRELLASIARRAKRNPLLGIPEYFAAQDQLTAIRTQAERHIAAGTEQLDAVRSENQTRIAEATARIHDAGRDNLAEEGDGQGGKLALSCLAGGILLWFLVWSLGISPYASLPWGIAGGFLTLLGRWMIKRWSSSTNDRPTSDPVDMLARQLFQSLIPGLVREIKITERISVNRIEANLAQEVLVELQATPQAEEADSVKTALTRWSETLDGQWAAVSDEFSQEIDPTEIHLGGRHLAVTLFEKYVPLSALPGFSSRVLTSIEKVCGRTCFEQMLMDQDGLFALWRESVAAELPAPTLADALEAVIQAPGGLEALRFDLASLHNTANSVVILDGGTWIDRTISPSRLYVGLPGGPGSFPLAGLFAKLYPEATLTEASEEAIEFEFRIHNLSRQDLRLAQSARPAYEKLPEEMRRGLLHYFATPREAASMPPNPPALLPQDAPFMRPTGRGDGRASRVPTVSQETER